MGRTAPLLAACLAAAALGGCASFRWAKEGAPPEAASQALAECQQMAWRESRYHAWLYPPAAPIPYRDATGRVFYVWPSYPFGDPFYDPFMEESRLTQFCMRSKGFHLERVPRSGS